MATTTKDVRVALLQYEPVWGQTDHNMELVDRLIARDIIGKSENVDLLILPEMAFTGYIFKDRETILPLCEKPRRGYKTFAWASEWAKKLNCMLTVGYPEMASKDKLYNSMLIIGPDGELMLNVRKTFLYVADKAWATEGSNFQSLYCPNLGCTVAFGICMDINPYEFKAPFHEYEFARHVLETKSQLIVFASAWTDSSPESDDVISTINYWATRLTPILEDLQLKDKTNVYFLCSNRIGKEDETQYAGCSCALSLREPKLLNFSNKTNQEILLATVNLKPSFASK